MPSLSVIPAYVRRPRTLQLLGEGDPAPVRVLRPTGASEFFLTADHAGRAIPRQLGTLGLPQSELERHIAWDIGIAGVTRQLAEALDATAVLQSYSRLVIDCNREPGWASSIPQISELTPIPGNQIIPPAEREARRREIFLPYHQEIAELLDHRRAAGHRTVLIAMHSFTPVFKGERRSIEVGVLYNRDRAPRRISSCSGSACVRRATSRSATTPPTRSPMRATTRYRCMANAEPCRMSRSRSART